MMHMVSICKQTHNNVNFVILDSCISRINKEKLLFLFDKKNFSITSPFVSVKANDLHSPFQRA